MPATNLIRTLVLGATFLLTGCIEIDQQVGLTRERGLDIAFEIKMARQAFDLSNVSQSGQGNAFCQRETLGPQLGMTILQELIVERDWAICRMTGHLDDFNSLQPNDMLSITRVDVGTYDVALTLAPPKEDVGQMQAMPPEMLQSMFAGRSWAASLSAPEILSGNGRINDARTGISIVHPLPDVFGQRGGQKGFIRLEARVFLKNCFFCLWGE